MRIELPIQWKMQGVNMACLPACLAMLLSARGETDETWNVIERFRMPYRIRVIPSEDRVVAGTGFEFDEWTRWYCMKEYGCELLTERVDAECAASRLEELLRGGAPVVLSVQRAPEGHAVVAYRINSGDVYVMDPDNGVRLRRPGRVGQYARPEVERVTGSELLKRLRRETDGKCVIGRLIESCCDGRVLPCDRDWIEGNYSHEGEFEGIEALKWIGRRIELLKARLDSERNAVRVREMFYEVGTNCFAPLVRNLFGAIVASGIVHLHNQERLGIYCGILEALEQMFDCFKDGLNRATEGDTIGEETWTGMSHALERLIEGFSRIDPE